MKAIRQGLPILLSLLLVLFFAAYGVLPSVGQSLVRMRQLVRMTMSGDIGIAAHSLYYGFTWLHTWYTVRLILAALVLAYCVGFALLLALSSVSWRPVAAVVDVLTTLLESVPDTFYIITTVVLVVYCVEHYGINLPAFNNMDPTWTDTWIPALALALPGAFYLRRVLALQLRDESASDYVETARSKGASARRVRFIHVLPNLGPTAIHQLPFISTMILSTALFAEFFMEYQGQLFQFTVSAGLSLEKGDMEGLYHIGTVAVIGFLLVALWWLFRGGSGALHRMLYPGDLVRTATRPVHRQVSWVWVWLGSLMVGTILFLGLFPHLLTPFSPAHKDTGSLTQVGPPFVPLSPSSVHPFGTDQLGHDVLAMALAGVYHSLIPAAVITAATIILSMVLAVAAFSSSARWLAGGLQVVSEVLSALPALFILFLALYHRTVLPGLQLVQFITWLTVIEAGRISYTLYQTMHEWGQLTFIEGAHSIGRSRLAILFTHLRSWLGKYTLELTFTEFVRIASVMTQLAAFHIYSQVTAGLLLYKQQNEIFWPYGIVSLHPSWFGMIGDSTLSLNFLSYPNYLAVPLVMLTITVVGMNLIARGIRGRAIENQGVGR